MKKAQDMGFTIVEVMIVLAVTGALFISAAILISGRQNKTEFSQGIRQIQSRIQQTINEVSSGFYPSTDNFSCTAGPTEPSITAGSTEQGANSGCVFLGKVMQFRVSPANDPEMYAVHSLAGLKKKPGTTQEAQSLKEAGVLTIPAALATSKLEGGITTGWVRYNGANPIGAVGFVSSLGKYDANNSLVSGTQQVDLVPITGTSLDQDTSTAANLIKIALRSEPTPSASDGVRICFDSGGTQQAGVITIGGGGRQLSVTLKIEEKKCSAIS